MDTLARRSLGNDTADALAKKGTELQGQHNSFNIHTH
jgi:hypothetical protein